MSEEMKMSDVFDLPLKTNEFNYYLSDSKGKVLGIYCNGMEDELAHAINVHDQNQETIAKLTNERDKTISLMSQSWKHKPHGDELIYNHTATLLDSIKRKNETITKQTERINELEKTTEGLYRALAREQDKSQSIPDLQRSLKRMVEACKNKC